MKEYPIPGTSDYTITDDGQIVSYKGNEPRILKRYKKPRYGSRTFRETQILRIDGKTYTRQISRIQLASILGRWPEPWEQARHMNGDPMDNSRENIRAGCALLNVIDDIESGERQTSPEYIQEAIERLKQLL